ncbi:MAG: flagellar biosynthesis protein FlhB [Wolinella sp.]
MADEEEKTEEPSSKKIEKAREEGNVPKSPELVGFFGLTTGLVLIFFLFHYWVSGTGKVFHSVMPFFHEDLGRKDVISLAISIALEYFLLVIPVFIALVIVGIIGNVSQFGFLLSPKAISPKFSKLNPISGFKNLFSLKKLLEGALLTTKVLAAFGIGFWVFLSFIGELTTVALFPLFDQMRWLGEKALILVGILLLFFFVMSMIDLAIKRYQYFKSLRMTKQEVKDEFKQMEGNPEIKRKIRQMMMQAAMKRMMQQLPSADVVITNPTHYAVALRYDPSKEHAPRVLAKGVDHLALRIKEIAREHDIHIVENRSLARELYRSVDVDKEIPHTLFQAVAEIIAYVHSINKNKNSI